MEDPFELDQQSLEAQLRLLQDSLDRWRRIKSGADEFATDDELAAAGDEFNWLTNEIQKSVKGIGWELDDLEETLRRMSDGKKQSRGGAERTHYLRDTRSLLAAIEAEVKAGGGARADEADGDGHTSGLQQRLQLPANSQEPPMSASTERLVESLFQPDEEDDDDELLIREDDLGSQQFSVLSPETDEETPLLRRLWQRHRPAMLLMMLVVVLLLLILIISVSTSRGKSA